MAIEHLQLLDPDRPDYGTTGFMVETATSHNGMYFGAVCAMRAVTRCGVS